MLQERSCPIFRRGDAAWGHACGRPVWGGPPKMAVGRVVSTTVSPEGGVGGRKSGI